MRAAPPSPTRCGERGVPFFLTLAYMEQALRLLRVDVHAIGPG